MSLLNKTLIMMYPTRTVIMVKIRSAWSWKKVNCSIRGDLLSWVSKVFQVAISKEILFIYEA